MMGDNLCSDHSGGGGGIEYSGSGHHPGFCNSDYDLSGNPHLPLHSKAFRQGNSAWVDKGVTLKMEKKTGSVFSEIRTKFHILSPVQKKIAEYIFEHSEEIIHFPISDLAENCNTSETTILRFLRKVYGNLSQSIK